MLSHVNAAELQYRHDSAQLDREVALRRSIREHQAARTADERELLWAGTASPARARRRDAWARPIGAHLQPATACAAC